MKHKPITWATFTKRTNDPKLLWVEAELDKLGIPHRRHGESWHAPILEVPEDLLDEAWTVLVREHGTGEIDDLGDNHPMFAHFARERMQSRPIAAVLGSLGGSKNTDAQRQARARNIRKAHALRKEGKCN